MIVVFAVKYRRRSEDERPRPIEGNFWLEILWSAIPLGLTMVMFVWGAIIYFDMYNPPNDALEISIVGRQWMWKAQHAEGQREINELHVPVGQAVKLTMTSEDVIHDVFSRLFASSKTFFRGVIRRYGSRRPRRGSILYIAPNIAARSIQECSGGWWCWSRPSLKNG